MVKVPDDQKHRLRPFRKRRTYIWEKRKFSRDELLEYLKRNNFRSADKLKAGRELGEPAVYDYQKEFGNWENARSTAFGIRDMDFGFDEKYLIKAVIEFNLWSVRAYNQSRKKDPIVFPSVYKIRKKWGGKWSIMVGAAKQDCLKMVMTAYSRLWRRLGRRPRLEEVKDAGISLDRATELYGGKVRLDKVMESWGIKDNEGETGSS